jgi:L-asparaginase II
MFIAEVWRGDIRESLHACVVVEVDERGALLSAWGDPEFITTFRSSAKPLQAIPLVTLPNSEQLDLTDEELAICCSSHPGLPRHTALAASVLALSGYIPDHLVCGPAGNPPVPLKHGCSGNHAGILAVAHLLGAPLQGYEKPDHPAQLLIRKMIALMASSTDMRIATDSCGIPTYGLRLREMAAAYASLCQAGAHWERIPQIMGKHPELIGPKERIDVRLMQASQGRIIAKTGAEGLLCLGLRDQGRGMAIKVLDGNPRPLGPVTWEALRRTGWMLTDVTHEHRLEELKQPKLWGPNGEVVGEIRLASA